MWMFLSVHVCQIWINGFYLKLALTLFDFMALCGKERRVLTEVFTAAVTIGLYYYRDSTRKRHPK